MHFGGLQHALSFDQYCDSNAFVYQQWHIYQLYMSVVPVDLACILLCFCQKGLFVVHGKMSPMSGLAWIILNALGLFDLKLQFGFCKT